MIKKLILEKCYYVPSNLEAGILYFSEEFGVACHLCPCGCGNKIVTPIGPTEWSFSEKNGEPTLYPSVGNWQLPCRSHYWVEEGFIKWSYQWSEEQILSGRQREEQRRVSHYDEMYRKKPRLSILRRFFNWLFNRDV